MIVLDTNLVSEALRGEPNQQVMDWLDRQTDGFAITSITIGELLTGARLLPGGKRRDGLEQAIEAVLLHWAIRFSYDEAAARLYAIMRETARKQGRGLSVEDGMIAAICAARGAQLATRNVSDFDFLPVHAINPWGKMT